MRISKQMEERLWEESQERFSPDTSPFEMGRQKWKDEREEDSDVSWKGSDHDGKQTA